MSGDLTGEQAIIWSKTARPEPMLVDYEMELTFGPETKFIGVPSDV